MTMNLTRTQFVCDQDGKKVAVLLPIEDFEELVEQLEQQEDLKAIREALKDPRRIPWEEAKKELRGE